LQFPGHRLYAESVTIFDPNTGKIPAPVTEKIIITDPSTTTPPRRSQALSRAPYRRRR
jgi:hypothetical protein